MGLLKVFIFFLLVSMQKDNFIQADQQTETISDFSDTIKYELPSCAVSFISQPAISLQKVTFLDKKLVDIVSEQQRPPILYDINLSIQEVNIVFDPKVTVSSEKMKEMFRKREALVEAYFVQLQGWIAAQFVEEIIKEIQKVNSEVRKFFGENLKEYMKGICEANVASCSKKFEENINIYGEKLSQNVQACLKFAERQPERMINKDKEQLMSILKVVRRCFDGKDSSVSCFGNLFSKISARLTGAAEKIPKKFDSQLETIKEKFKKCVADRKNLFDNGRQQLVNAATMCLEPEE